MKIVITKPVNACAGCGERLEIGSVAWEQPRPSHWDESETERLHLACYAASEAAAAK